jgi:putative SOS response-associated peptidase YedK
MCGRITQKGGELPGLVTVTLIEEQFPPRFNGAPSQPFWVIRRHPQTGEYHRDQLVCGLIPHWCKDPDGGRKPINAKAETITSLPSSETPALLELCLMRSNRALSSSARHNVSMAKTHPKRPRLSRSPRGG